jgi:hypothetical protein
MHRTLRRVTPQAIRTVLKSVLPTRALRRLGYSANSLIEVAESMSNRGVSVDAQQLRETVECIRDFHEARQQ